MLHASMYFYLYQSLSVSWNLWIHSYLSISSWMLRIHSSFPLHRFEFQLLTVRNVAPIIFSIFAYLLNLPFILPLSLVCLPFAESTIVATAPSLACMTTWLHSGATILDCLHSDAILKLLCTDPPLRDTFLTLTGLGCSVPGCPSRGRPPFPIWTLTLHSGPASQVDALDTMFRIPPPPAPCYCILPWWHPLTLPSCQTLLDSLHLWVFSL